MAGASKILKLFQVLLYTLAFLCSGAILGIFSFFLAVQNQNNVEIPMWQLAVEGMSGSGVLYTIFAMVLTCCLGAIPFFAFIAIIFNLLFVGAFIAIAVLTRDGANSCTGIVQTPLGSGIDEQLATFGNTGFPGQGALVTLSLTFGTACRLNTVVFGVSIIGAVLFLFCIFVQLKLGRQHQRAKDYASNPVKEVETRAFTSGGVTGRESSYSASTVDNATGTYIGNKFETSPPNHSMPIAGGYQSTSLGNSVNPYGYDNRSNARANNPYGYDSRPMNY